MVKVLSLLLVVTTGCVSQAKYTQLERDHRATQARLQAAEKRNEEMAKSLEVLRQDRDGLRSEAEGLAEQLAITQRTMDEHDVEAAQEKEALLRQVEEHRARAEALEAKGTQASRKLSSMNREMQRYYQQELMRLRVDLAVLRKEARAKEANLRRQVEELDGISGDAAARVAIEQKRALEESLAGDVTRGRVAVSSERNEVTVAISSSALFETDVLSSEGQGTLNAIADVLRRYPDHDVRVEGHTSASVDGAGNWARSSQRAVAVLAYLTQEAALAPDRLSAVGFAEFKPRGNSVEDPANSRIELRITPVQRERNASRQAPATVSVDVSEQARVN